MGEVPIRAASYDGVTAQLLGYARLGLPLNQNMLDAQAELGATAASVQAALAKYVRPNSFVRVVTGPAASRRPGPPPASNARMMDTVRRSVSISTIRLRSTIGSSESRCCACSSVLLNEGGRPVGTLADEIDNIDDLLARQRAGEFSIDDAVRRFVGARGLDLPTGMSSGFEELPSRWFPSSSCRFPA